MSRAVFLDRDGVLNVKLPENRYVRSWEEFTFRDGVVEALRMLRARGYLLIVVTNQRGIGRGMMSEDDLAEVHRRMRSELAKEGVKLDTVLHCPHNIEENCRCRKPRPGMLAEAIGLHGVDPARSFIVGDSESDLAAGRAVGVAGILVADDGISAPEGCRRVATLLEAARLITGAEKE